MLNGPRPLRSKIWMVPVTYYSDDAFLLPPNAPLAHQLASDSYCVGFRFGSGRRLHILPGGTRWRWPVPAIWAIVCQKTQKNAQQKTVIDHGKFVEVWKKQSPTCFNSDLPTVHRVRNLQEKKGFTMPRLRTAANTTDPNTIDQPVACSEHDTASPSAQVQIKQ